MSTLRQIGALIEKLKGSDVPATVIVESVLSMCMAAGESEPLPRAVPVTPRPVDRSVDGDFEEFYKAFPKHVNRAAASAKYRTVRKRGISHHVLMDGVRRYVLSVAGTESKFVKAPDAWLNAGKWEDEYQTNLSLVLLTTGDKAASAASQGRFYAAADTRELQAWKEHFRALGRSLPVDKNGGWSVDSQWPPGHQERAA